MPISVLGLHEEDAPLTVPLASTIPSQANLSARLADLSNLSHPCPLRIASVKSYCDSFDCPDGSALIAGASDVQCKRIKCKKAECCETACSSFDCPTNLLPVEDSDTTVCEDSGCTEDLCCEMGKASYEM